jgi:hypothetical protein
VGFEPTSIGTATSEYFLRQPCGHRATDLVLAFFVDEGESSVLGLSLFVCFGHISDSATLRLNSNKSKIFFLEHLILVHVSRIPTRNLPIPNQWHELSF